MEERSGRDNSTSAAERGEALAAFLEPMDEEREAWQGGGGVGGEVGAGEDENRRMSGRRPADCTSSGIHFHLGVAAELQPPIPAVIHKHGSKKRSRFQF